MSKGFFLFFDTSLLDIMSKSFVSLLSPPSSGHYVQRFAFSFCLSTFGHYVQRFCFPFLTLHFWTLCPKVCFLFLALHFWTLCPKVLLSLLALHFWTLCPKVLLPTFSSPLLDIRKTTVINRLQWLEDFSILF